MKRGLKLLLLMGVLSPLGVKAATISLDCHETVKTGSEVVCSIKSKGTELIAGVEASVSASTGLTYKSYTKASVWSGTSSSSKFLIYGAEVSGEQTLGTYTYTVGSTATGNLKVTLNNIMVSDSNGDAVTSNTKAEDSIRVLSNVNTLSSLSVSGATINFSSDVVVYNVEVDSATTTISATATDSYAKVTGTGSKTLKYGNNSFEVVVTSEMGTKKTYTINVTRPDNRSTDNSLKELTLNNGTINFASGTTTYNVEVDSDKTTISAVANDTKATVKGVGAKTLNYGANKFQIVVTAENGSTKTYTLNITRKDNRSTDNTLKELTINNGTINFASGTTTYNVEVDSDKTTISAVANDTKATVKGVGAKTLNYGANKFQIVVTAENGSTKTYTLNITRKDNRSNNNNLSSLTLSEAKLGFDKNKLTYEVEVDNSKNMIMINGKAEDTKAKVEGLGTKTLQEGKNTFIIKVTAENTSVKEYKIVVIRNKEEAVTSSNKIKSLLVEGNELITSPDVKEYNITTDKDTIDLKIELDDVNSSYEVVGNKDLKDGSIIQIIVTDKSGNNNIYSITVEKVEKEVADEDGNQGSSVVNVSEDDINYIPIIMVSLLGLFVVIDGVLIVNIKKKKANK